MAIGRLLGSDYVLAMPDLDLGPNDYRKRDDRTGRWMIPDDPKLARLVFFASLGILGLVYWFKDQVSPENLFWGVFIMAGAAVKAFHQEGDDFRLDTSVEDISAANPGTSAVTRTLASVPTGLVVFANVCLILTNSGSAVATSGLLSPLDSTDEAVGETGPTDTGAVFTSTGIGGGSRAFPGNKLVKTNTSAQIRSRLGASDANVTLRIRTFGWVDTRGRLN